MERFGFRIDLQEKVVNLSVGMKQRVEILKTLYRGADIIIPVSYTHLDVYKRQRGIQANGHSGAGHGRGCHAPAP